MNERQSPANGDSAVILFGSGGYCALTFVMQIHRIVIVKPLGA